MAESGASPSDLGRRGALEQVVDDLGAERAGGCLARLAYLAAIAACGSMLLAGVFTDRFAWSQWWWWIPWPIWFLGSLPALAAVLVDRGKRRWFLRLGAIVSTAVILCTGVLRDVRVRSAPRGPGELSILHWNASWPDSEEGLAPSDELLAREADVVLISNPYRLFNDGRADTWRARGYEVVIPGVFAIASRVPVMEARMVHAEPDTGAALIVLDARSTLGRVLRILIVDLPSNPRLHRMEVSRSFRAAIDAQELGPIDLIVGDTNITRGSASLNLLAPGMRHAWDESGVGWGGTWPRGLPLLHLDQAFLGPEIESTSYRVFNPRSGDHLAQEVRIRAVASRNRGL